MMELYPNKFIVIGKWIYYTKVSHREYTEDPCDLVPTWNLQLVTAACQHKIVYYIFGSLIKY